MPFNNMPSPGTLLYEGMEQACLDAGITVQDISPADWLAALNEAEAIHAQIHNATRVENFRVGAYYPAAVSLSAFIKQRARELAVRHAY